MIQKIALSILTATAISFAYNHDFFFRSESSGKLCVSKTPYNISKVDAQGNNCNTGNYIDDVRIRVIDPTASLLYRYGISFERPFFILDGIYLSTDGERTLAELEDEANRLGIVDVLTEMGYTPILVQFTETVRTSLEQNAETFSKLLQFINSNTSIGFSDKMENGMIVMGISQGGILGRYGAYLYDKQRNSKTDAPIRLYASLDSPHQGAVLPRSLYPTIDFWATSGGSSAAEAFKDLINGPGASGLLIYERKQKCTLPTFCDDIYRENFGNDRFLFNEYRNAAEYKGFPSVLISQGQLKGTVPQHSNVFFVLNRYAKKAGILMARIESEMYSSDAGMSKIGKNRIYKKFEEPVYSETSARTEFDFVQGSTYPFSETMYQSLHEGFEDAMPNKMTVDILGISTTLSTGWEQDLLSQKSSTFIPTASAMDMNCDGKIAMNQACAHTQSSTDFPFTNPGNRSSANAAYAVDPTHPRYNEPISGRHIELPTQLAGNENSAVVNGFRVDMWRILCELANYDYNPQAKEFRNVNLSSLFTPGTNCMDQTKMPFLIKNSGNLQKKYLAYSKYDYTPRSNAQGRWNTFEVPAGWHKVALYNTAEEIPEGTTFEVDIQVEKAKGNWMKAELLLSKGRNGAGQVQLQEIDIPLNGSSYTARWQLPANKALLNSYRWFRLVLNSDGAKVAVKDARLVRSMEIADAPKEKIAKDIYPNSKYSAHTWSSNTAISPYSDALGTGTEVNFKHASGGMYFDFGGMKNMEGYSALKITYWPGTCQYTSAYFDSYKKKPALLKYGITDGNFESLDIPLSQIVDISLTPQNKLVASRLTLQSMSADEKCLVKSIMLH